MAMTKKVHFSIRLEPAMLKALKREGDRLGVSASSLARQAVKFYIDGNAGYNRRVAA